MENRSGIDGYTHGLLENDQLPQCRCLECHALSQIDGFCRPRCLPLLLRDTLLRSFRAGEFVMITDRVLVSGEVRLSGDQLEQLVREIAAKNYKNSIPRGCPEGFDQELAGKRRIPLSNLVP